MEKIINFSQATNLAQKLRSNGKIIILVGGCFDLLHTGHLHFLEKAKKTGDVLLIALESDENVKKLKGQNRPINPQLDRAKILAALVIVDYVILLPEMTSYQDYLVLVKNLQPAVIATTTKDPQIGNKRKQAIQVRAKVKIVSPLIEKKSTSQLAQILETETTL